MSALPDITHTIEALAQVCKPPHEIIEKAVDYRWAFGSVYPSETESDGEPPKHVSERDEVIQVDGVLGTMTRGNGRSRYSEGGSTRLPES